MQIVIDFETRSPVKLKDCGVVVYAEHPDTDVLCLATKEDDKEPKLWVPKKFRGLYLSKKIKDDELISLIEKANTIHAHNLFFESTIWHHIMHKGYGFPDLSKEKLRCSAALASSYALPSSLEKACFALGLEEQKDKTGYNIMMKMCKPRRLLKAEMEMYPEISLIPDSNPPEYYNEKKKKSSFVWHDDPSDFKLLCDYCKQDISAEYALSKALYPLSNSELECWRHDQVINNRGIKIDVDGVNTLMKKIEECGTRLLLEVQTITKGKVKSTNQVSATIDWLNSQGFKFKNLQKGTVEKALLKDITGDIKRILEIRQALSLTSVAKLMAMKNQACADERARDLLVYHGSSTGRWAGSSIQPQNLPRDSFSPEAVEDILSLDTEMIEILYDCPIKSASRCIRGMITCEKDNTLYAADFSSIEARVLAWLAGENKVLNDYKEGLDPYIVVAETIYGIPYTNIKKDSKERFVGKTITLACGYQGWINAFRAMATEEIGKMSDDEIKEVILKWRNARIATVTLWKELEKAALLAVKTGKPHAYGRIKFGMRRNFLHCRLPSGRLLSYYDPSIQMVKPKYGPEKEAVSFMGTNSTTKKWERQFTYGGKLTENIIQALSRDLLVFSMSTVEKAGYPVVMHVHDEIICETKEDFGSVKEFEELMVKLPYWGLKIPMEAKGWVGKRYRK